MDKIHAEFRRSAVHQVFALDLDADSEDALVYLEAGGADRLRERASAGRLICPIPRCASPLFSTVGGTRRHHFRHRSHAPDHAPETVAHFQGKQLIARWVRQRHPEAIVHVDDQEVESGRRPDVLIEFPDGRRIAVEIQYAGLTPDQWRARHQDYARDGVRDVWLFGCGRRYLRLRKEESGPATAELPELLRHVLAERVPALWINPFTEQIAVALPGDDDALRLKRRRNIDPAAVATYMQIDISPLAEARIERLAIRTAALDQWRARVADLWRSRVAAARERRARRMLDRTRRWAVAQAERQRRTRAEEFKQRIEEHERREFDVLCKRHFPGTGPPSVVHASLRTDRLILKLPELWKTQILVYFVMKPPGTQFWLTTIARHFIRGSDEEREHFVYEAVKAFLRLLRSEGLVDFEEYRRRPTTPITVVRRIRP